MIKTRYKGLFLIEAGEEALQKVKDYETTAICRVIPLDTVIPAHLPDIIRETITVTQKKLQPGESFAVRCKRRGFSVSSKEIEQKIGAEIVETFKNPVNLDNPDKIVLIEIIDKKAGISVLKKDDIVKKEVIEL